MKSKLVDELPELVKNKVISEEIALKIRHYYQTHEAESPNKLFTVFGVLGALLVGLGIILILAHNWDDFSRALKTGLAFFPLILGQVLAGYVILKNKSAAWREAAGTFLFFTVGSSIALVSQIYNISGDLTTYVLTWIVLCLPLVYLLKSNAVAMLHIVFSTFYAVSIGFGFNGVSEAPWLYVVLLALIIPHYLKLLKHLPGANVTSIFNWLLPLSVSIAFGTFVESYGDLGYLNYIILFGLFYNIGKLPVFDDRKLRRNAYLIFGSVGTVVMLLISSFIGMWNFGTGENVFASGEFFITLILFGATLGLLIYRYSKHGLKSLNLFPFVFIIFSILFFSGLLYGLMAIIFVNLLVLVLGLTTIKMGSDKYHFGILNYGLLIITSLIVCRFFDTDMSYVIRGLLLVSVGVGFFLTNYILLKRKK